MCLCLRGAASLNPGLGLKRGGESSENGAVRWVGHHPAAVLGTGLRDPLLFLDFFF